MEFGWNGLHRKNSNGKPICAYNDLTLTRLHLICLKLYIVDMVVLLIFSVIHMYTLLTYTSINLL